MIFNLRETNSNLKDDVVENDRTLVIELCRYVLGEDLRFSTSRLGVRNKREENGEEKEGESRARPGEANPKYQNPGGSDPGRKPQDTSDEVYIPWPIRVTFVDLDCKIKFMRNLHKLANADVPKELLTISIKHDLTVDKRKLEKKS